MSNVLKNIRKIFATAKAISSSEIQISLEESERLLKEMLSVHFKWTDERCIFFLYKPTVPVITDSIYCSAALPLHTFESLNKD